MAAKPVESLSWYWNPGRAGVRLGPEWFRDKLKMLGDELEVTWDAYNERWCIFMKQPRVTHPLGRGWTLLFKVQNADGTFAPLDEQVLGRLFFASQKRWGSGQKYWEAMEREAERERLTAEKDEFQNTMDQSMESFDHSQISVAMRGKSNGSKFSDYHA